MLQALDRYHDDQAAMFMSVLQSVVVSIAAWQNDQPSGKPPASSRESSAVVKPCRPSCEAIQTFLHEYSRQKELSEKLMDVDDVEVDDVSDEVKDSETDRTLRDDDGVNMMCDDVKQEPPDHIKLVMEV